MSELVFVYGTLKHNYGNHHVMEQAGGKFVTETELFGYEMYSLGGFPAITPGKGVVYGEIYKVNDLAPLDALEGYPHFYNRRQVLLEAKQPVWVYYMENKPSGPEVIDGVW